MIEFGPGPNSIIQGYTAHEKSLTTMAVRLNRNGWGTRIRT